MQTMADIMCGIPAVNDGEVSLGWLMESCRKRGFELDEVRSTLAAPPAFEHRCDTCGGSGYLRRDVPVGHPDFGRLFPCREAACERRRQDARERAMLESVQPLLDTYTTLRDDLRGKTFDNYRANRDNSGAYHAARAWALARIGKAEAPPWLFLCGTTGNGKTHLAAAAANGLRSQDVPLIFSTQPELVGMMEANKFANKDAVIQALARVPVLVLDDLGAGASYDWVRAAIYRVIDIRYNNAERRPTLFVSNALLRAPHGRVVQTIGELIDHRVMSRLSDKRICRVVINTDVDRREAGW